jgi:type VI secretion system secreted protein VgrG
VLQQAAQDGTPFCEECARAAEEEAAEQTTSWIEVELVGDDDKPVSGERYTVTLPDGTVEEGTLDDHGIARIEQFEPGNCKISFPDLDEEAWEEA